MPARCPALRGRGGDGLIDRLDALGDEFFHLVLAIGGLILRKVVGRRQRLDAGHRLTAQVARRDFGLLAHLFDLLDELLSALLREFGEHEADDRAVVGGIQPQGGLQDGLFDGLEQRFVPRADDEAARVEHGDVAQLVERAHAAVRLHLQFIEDVRIGAPGADAGKFLLQDGNRLFKLLFENEKELLYLFVFDHDQFSLH